MAKFVFLFSIPRIKGLFEYSENRVSYAIGLIKLAKFRLVIQFSTIYSITAHFFNYRHLPNQ